MTIKTAPPKRPNSVKWYWLLWSSDELQGATISTSTWSLPNGIVQDQIAVSGLTVGIKLSSGTLDQDYDISNTITTSNGETLSEDIVIRVRDSGH